jgi:hypothetical protein
MLQNRAVPCLYIGGRVTGVFSEPGEAYKPYFEEDGARSWVYLYTWLRLGFERGWKVDEGPGWGRVRNSGGDFEVEQGRGMAGDLAVEVTGILGKEV